MRFSCNSSTQRSVPALYTDHKTPKQPTATENKRNLKKAEIIFPKLLTQMNYNLYLLENEPVLYYTLEHMYNTSVIHLPLNLAKSAAVMHILLFNFAGRKTKIE